ncbi:MAG TPA: YbhB/YbcL family Raf kinase inhibitor-like protein [Candidatus Polarisedimenticolia bacterium]|nr:YbhB/YbcL family Raf kinase inhibitor-like protein [Candidatus Polarisedimenticolia bacterium]
MRTTIARALVTAAFLLAVTLGPASAQQDNVPQPARPNIGPPLILTIPAFSDGGTIPVKYTCAASTPPPGGPMHISLGVSPLLRWSKVPKATESFVLILHDPDAHMGKTLDDITHWVIFNIPGDATSLPEGVPPDAPLANGTLQGDNMMRRAAYQGPCAPPDHPPHHYAFQLYALDKKLDLPQGASRDEIQKAMEGHVLASTTYMGRFALQASPSSPDSLRVQ